MVDLTSYISELKSNRAVFKNLLQSFILENVKWKVSSEKWCALEIVCHLLDEEKDDFRYRLQHLIETPQKKMPSIDPVAWVLNHEYMEQDFGTKVDAFLSERSASILYLEKLDPLTAYWENTYENNYFGLLKPVFFLTNWIAHDYLHIKQLTRLKYDLLASKSECKIEYAGEWT